MCYPGLKYILILCEPRPALLRALLGCSVSGSQHASLPWVKPVLQDVAALYEFHNEKLVQLGHPDSNLEGWVDFMCRWPTQWKESVNKYMVCESITDSATKLANKRANVSHGSWCLAA